jgi:hypothetical protein
MTLEAATQQADWRLGKRQSASFEFLSEHLPGDSDAHKRLLIVH